VLNKVIVTMRLKRAFVAWPPLFVSGP